MSKHCEKREKKESCCNAIEAALGDYFLRSAQVLDSTAVNALLGVGGTTLEDLQARTTAVVTYLSIQNAKIRATFANLFITARCNSCSSCCIGTAGAIANAGVGYVTLVNEAILSLGIPVASLPTVIATITAGYDATILTILTGSKCTPVVIV